MHRPRRTFPPRRRPAGPVRFAFTLVELLIVMAITGIAAAIVVPRYGSAAINYKLKVSAGRLVSDWSAARELAVAGSRHHRIEFSKGRGGYWVMQGDDPVSAALWHADLSAPPYDSQILAADFDGSRTATITGYGLPSAAGTVSLTAGDRMITVSVSKDGSASAGSVTGIPKGTDRTGLDLSLSGDAVKAELLR